ncbi:MAG: transketolase, partial [Gemmatimonadetes bacterium]|nr:transketolase [Gemmatimonadota bacterium]
PEDFVDSTVISNRSRLLARDWFPHRTAEEYAITSDWDDRWRTGGTLDEVIEEAHLSEPWILKGIERFAKDREKRLNRIRETVEAALDA